jgi:hypothetical protein
MKSASVAFAACALLPPAAHLFAQDRRGAAGWEPETAPITTRWASDVAPDNVHPEYPRPQMVRAEWVNLNGLWEFEPGEQDEEPPFRRPLERSILVPFPVESALSGVMERHDRLWYRRVFEVPEEWSGKRILLHFGAVDWETRVWVNGELVGEHRGGYDPFSFDITDALLPGAEEQVILVGVWDPTDASTQPRGKQVRNPQGIWYTPTTGIWQTVWLEPVADSRVLRVDVQARLSGIVTVAPQLWLPRPGTYTIGVTARDGGDVAGGVEMALNAAAGTPITTPSITFELLDTAKPWSPESPHLYDLEVILRAFDPDHPERHRVDVDRVDSYFGLREISVRAGEDEAAGATPGPPAIFLNGEPYFMIGTLDQGFWPDGLYTAPSDEALRFDIEQTKRMGFNTIRKHVKVEPARWYYWCDKLGILVWQDMPSGDAYIGGDDPDLVRSEESAQQFERELRAMIGALRNHPSIVMWVPFNEGWGQFDTARITDLVRELDPTRLVNSASGWTDRGTGDVHDIHAYPGPAAPAVEEHRAGVLGEFGGLGLPIEGHTWSAPEAAWGYQGMQDEEELARRYESLLRRVYELKESAGLAAAIYTQITDVETETNGLMTYDRAVMKVDPARIARANKGDFPQLETLVPCAMEDQTIEWRYMIEQPPAEWFAPEFDDSSWKSGRGGFGTEGTPGAVIGTEWNSSDIWIRRTFRLPEARRSEGGGGAGVSGTGVPPVNNIRLFIHHDEDAEVYINGVLAAKVTGYTTAYEDVPLSPEARAALKAGPNVLAIHCRQTRGGQYIDAGLMKVGE